jgi:hypothetical protein
MVSSLLGKARRSRTGVLSNLPPAFAGSRAVPAGGFAALPTQH